MRLYKYTSLKWLPQIAKGEICFTAADKLNDPYESVWVFADDGWSQIVDAHFHEYGAPIVTDLGERVSRVRGNQANLETRLKRVKDHLDSKENQVSPSLIQKFTELSSNVANRETDFNRLFGGIENVERHLRKDVDRLRGMIWVARTAMLRGGGLNNLGIFSASAVRDDLLMWSHYGESYGGVVIGFDRFHPFFSAEVAEKNLFLDSHDVLYRSSRSASYEIWDHIWSFLKTRDYRSLSELNNDAFAGWVHESQIGLPNLLKISLIYCERLS